MLKVEDLRLGNAFVQQGSSFVEFATIGDLVRIHEGVIIAEPIPLTEEWLFRLGFTGRLSDDWYALNINDLVVYFNGETLQIENHGEHGGLIYRKNGDNYVHTLQNIIHALTNTEITCN